MRVEASYARIYTAEWNESYPRLQLLTVADLLRDKSVAHRGWSRNTTYNSAPWLGDVGHSVW